MSVILEGVILILVVFFVGPALILAYDYYVGIRHEREVLRQHVRFLRGEVRRLERKL
jgi:hypothetical protein